MFMTDSRTAERNLHISVVLVLFFTTVLIVAVFS